MARGGSLVDRAHLWTVLVGLGALAFWVVGIGAGWRTWLLLDDIDPGRGIVAHAQAFGTDASVWWVPAAILTLTTVVIALGVTLLRTLAPSGETDPEVDPEQSADSEDDSDAEVAEHSS